ncbi:hypothetical protein BFJ69_g17043 [Fusarium oxysporum]|uniref:Uncharacterized protein n=1 Tax=Fusarium oxysporum TaxID=5507 RepID=A0A420M9D0_FUSOX|nr:hypothetical protein BFJ69_g17043 [Fusarium oxysporum]
MDFKALYSILILVVRSLAPDFSPVIMTCYDDWLYYLVATKRAADKCTGSPMLKHGKRCEALPFNAAPGVETLDVTGLEG